MGWWQRVTDIVSEVIDFVRGDISQDEDERSNERSISDWFDEQVPPIVDAPEIPDSVPSAAAHDFADMVDELGLRDQYAQDLLSLGWYSEDIDPDTRMSAREAFFDFTGIDYEDFPWEEWREYYEAS